MRYRFRTPAVDCFQLSKAGLPIWQARLFAARNVTDPEEAQLGLHKLLHFRDLKGIDEAAERLLQAIAQKERILIVGDYDADGATATAVMVRGLRMLGAAYVDFIVPDRLRHGYGLSPELAELAYAKRADLLVTVDNGISALEGVERARSLGMDVVITDHHAVGAELPPTPWIINPKQPGCAFASKAIAGVGVAFYLLLAMRAKLVAQGAYGQGERPPLEQLLDLVALGTVADVVPLDANNRRLVAAGLMRIRKGAAKPLLKALFACAARSAAWASSADLAFAIAPRLNAAGRLQHMALGIEGLLTDDAAVAEAIAAELHRINDERRTLQAEMQAQAIEIAKRSESAEQAGLVVYQPHWHEGVIGLIASQLKERYWRPVVVFADSQHTGFLKGSGRSIPGLHLRDAIEEVTRLLPGAVPQFGGHAMAAGLLLRAEALMRFADAFEAVCRQRLAPAALERIVLLDEPLQEDEINAETALALEAIPWGEGFEEPLFGSELAIVRQEVVKEQHLRLWINRGDVLIKGICFNRTKPIQPASLLAWQLMPDRWGGSLLPQIRIEHVFD